MLRGEKKVAVSHRLAADRPAGGLPCSSQPAGGPAGGRGPGGWPGGGRWPARRRAAGERPGAGRLAACRPAGHHPTSFQLRLLLRIGTFFCRFYVKSARPICESGAIRLQNCNLYQENDKFLRRETEAFQMEEIGGAPYGKTT